MEKALSMSKYLFVPTVTVLLFMQTCIALAATQITGTIVAKRGDLVKVEFQPDKSVGPKVGDKVNFATTKADIPINCGTGKVTEVNVDSVWIKPVKTNLKLKMDAVIHATGLAKKKKVVEKNKIPPQHQCDELAGDPWDKQHIGPTVEFNNINVYQAIAACQDAVNEYPGTTRFIFQLARAYTAGEQHGKALPYYQQAAIQNYAAAQFNMAVMYALGHALPKDQSKSFKWSLRAALKGHFAAQYKVGWMWDVGEGTPQDYNEAIKWYRKAADQGFDKAQHALGLMYKNGQGVQKNLQEAVHWFKKAASQGYEDAKEHLAELGY